MKIDAVIGTSTCTRNCYVLVLRTPILHLEMAKNITQNCPQIFVHKFLSQMYVDVQFVFAEVFGKQEPRIHNIAWFKQISNELFCNAAKVR
jgi:hypothetical protein